ncbi:hypothetical protein A6U98_00300 [Rhizobium sp. WYCCWR10014]|nr:hypothetical protein A6U98_00300 [Rhizobium sp. WYCCWR10014]
MISRTVAEIALLKGKSVADIEGYLQRALPRWRQDQRGRHSEAWLIMQILVMKGWILSRVPPSYSTIAFAPSEATKTASGQTDHSDISCGRAIGYVSQDQPLAANGHLHHGRQFSALEALKNLQCL